MATKLLHVGPDRPEQKSVSACGENEDNVGARGCFFYKSDLHIVLTQFEIKSNSIQFDSIQNMVHKKVIKSTQDRLKSFIWWL